MDQNLQQMQGQLLVLNANLDIDIARLKAKKARVLEELKEVTEALQKEAQAKLQPESAANEQKIEALKGAL